MGGVAAWAGWGGGRGREGRGAHWAREARAGGFGSLFFSTGCQERDYFLGNNLQAPDPGPKFRLGSLPRELGAPEGVVPVLCQAL